MIALAADGSSSTQATASPSTQNPAAGQKRSATAAGNLDSQRIIPAWRRTTSACQRCRARKVRCVPAESGTACKSCESHEAECVFTESTRLSKPLGTKLDNSWSASDAVADSTAGAQPSTSPSVLESIFLPDCEPALEDSLTAILTDNLDNHLDEEYAGFTPDIFRVNPFEPPPTLFYDPLSYAVPDLVPYNFASPYLPPIVDRSALDANPPPPPLAETPPCNWASTASAAAAAAAAARRDLLSDLGRFRRRRLAELAELAQGPYALSRSVEPEPMKERADCVEYSSKKGTATHPEEQLRGRLFRDRSANPYMPLLHQRGSLRSVSSGDGSGWGASRRLKEGEKLLEDYRRRRAAILSQHYDMLAQFMKPSPVGLHADCTEFLRKKGTSTHPEEQLQSGVLRDHIDLAYPSPPSVDFQDFLRTIVLDDNSGEEDSASWSSDERKKREMEYRRKMALAILRIRKAKLRVAIRQVLSAEYLAKSAQELDMDSVDMSDAHKALDEKELQQKLESFLQSLPSPQHDAIPLPPGFPKNSASSPTISSNGNLQSREELLPPAERRASPDFSYLSIPQSVPEKGSNGAQDTALTLNSQDNDPFLGHGGDASLLGQRCSDGSSRAFGLAGNSSAWLGEDMSKILEGVGFGIDDAIQVLETEVN